MVHPIRDQYSTRGPAHTRSAAFVQTKGLVANEKTSLLPSRISSSFPPAAQAVADQPKQTQASFMTASLLRSRVPEATSFSRPRIPYASSTAVNAASHSGTDASNNATSTHADGMPSAAASSLPARQQPPKPPSQGNIKKKRMLLSDLEHTPTVAPEHVEGDPITPVTPGEPPRNNYGDPNKIARFFPELNTITT